jgi:hypothetical protein
MATFGFDFIFMRSYPNANMLALEGILAILFGACFLIGSGGMSRNTASAAVLASAAKALDGETIGPSEILRRDAWKPKGYARLGLAIIGAGTILIALSIVLA